MVGVEVGVRQEGRAALEAANREGNLRQRDRWGAFTHGLGWHSTYSPTATRPAALAAVPTRLLSTLRQSAFLSQPLQGQTLINSALSKRSHPLRDHTLLKITHLWRQRLRSEGHRLALGQHLEQLVHISQGGGLIQGDGHLQLRGVMVRGVQQPPGGINKILEKLLANRCQPSAGAAIFSTSQGCTVLTLPPWSPGRAD